MKPQLGYTSNKYVNTPVIAAIITCYFPKAHELVPLIKSIRDQVNQILLINNGGLNRTSLDQFNNLKLEVIDPAGNLGTAGGYNIGAQRAWELNCSHVLLLDQDSDCAPDMLAKLLSLESHLFSIGKKVAVVGPYYVSKNSNLPAPFIQHEGYRIKRIYDGAPELLKMPNGEFYTCCSYVISSGSLINRSTWETVGNKNEKLFLDFTDIEWGLRAQSQGFLIYGSFSARMFHLIGDEQVNFLGRKISLHSPRRHYYAFRNSVWLFKQSFIPMGIRANYVLKLAPKLFVYSWFSPEPWQQFKAMIGGIRDGILNRMGAFSK